MNLIDKFYELLMFIGMFYAFYLLIKKMINFFKGIPTDYSNRFFICWILILGSLFLGTKFSSEKIEAYFNNKKDIQIISKKDYKDVKSTSELIILNSKTGQEYYADTTKNIIKGNKKSKIYHVPGGASYNKISVKNVVFFETEEDAIRAGYRRAQN